MSSSCTVLASDFGGKDATIVLTDEELYYLLSGTQIELKIKRNEVFERRIS